MLCNIVVIFSISIPTIEGKRREMGAASKAGDLLFKAFVGGLGVTTIYLTATFSVNVYRGLSWHKAQSVTSTIPYKQSSVWLLVVFLFGGKPNCGIFSCDAWEFLWVLCILFANISRSIFSMSIWSSGMIIWFRSFIYYMDYSFAFNLLRLYVWYMVLVGSLKICLNLVKD